MKRQRNKGFTLVELLIVLGILICLVGILLPAINHAREDARRTACVSKVRQLTMAWLTYAGDNERKTCGAGAWIGPAKGKLGLESGLLWPYVKDDDVFRCADDRTTGDDSPNRSSFQMNATLPGKLDDLSQAPKVFVFIEGCGLGFPPRSFALSSGFAPPAYPQSSWTGSYPGENHKGGSVADVGTPISFADGHAIFWKYSDFRTGNIRESLGSGHGSGTLNSQDVYQLEAWSGGTVPPGMDQ